MTNNEINVGDKNQLFYGLSLPSHVVDDINVDKDTELVFDNKNDVLKAMKLYKGSRFKAFHNIDDAIEYSKQVIKPEECCGDSNKSVRNLEKSLSPFSGLHPRELARLRKAIENDSYETVNQLIWSNPRFLVSSGDTPVILMEGFRYNSCHIAAKAGKHNILQLILNTVSDKTFMKLLFPYDADDVTESRIKFLLDLYLNTPEKGFCETPLHFGCKFGYTEVVAVLLKYQICDIEKLNKNSRKPYEVICERKGDEITKRKIQKLFKSQIYLPLFRDDFSAQIGKPVKGVVHDSTVSALAGPMSADEANHLFETLKSPRKSTPQQRKIRLTDSRKGLERIARNICKEMNINWIEFWPFLNCSIDLTADEGLNRLEKHLRTVYYELDSNFNKSKYNYNYSLSESQDMKSDINSLVNDLSNLSFNPNISINLSQKYRSESYNNDLDKSAESGEHLSSCNDTLKCCDSDCDSDESFISASSSPTFLFDFYVNGSKLTKEDIDAALALQYIIDSNKCLDYDYIQSWFHRVISEEPQHFDYH